MPLANQGDTAENCTLDDVVYAMVWLRQRAVFAALDKRLPNFVTVLNELLVDVKVGVEVVAYRPLP